MSKYKFSYQRRTDDGGSESVAEAIVTDDGFVSWFLNEELFKRAVDLSSIRIGGQFDQTNLEHWMALPEILRGGREWVAYEGEVK